MLPFTLPQNVDRYHALMPRLENFLARLRRADLLRPATPVERELARSLVQEARRVTSRDSFGKSLRALRSDELASRQTILDRLEEADTALAAFHALYYCEDGDDFEDGPFWRYVPPEEY